MTGYSRDTYYRLKQQYQSGGLAALRHKSRRRRLPANQVDEHIQERILEYAYEYPEMGQKAVAERLCAEGLKVSPNGVRSVWLRYDLENRHKRLDALRAKASQGEIIISEKQMDALRLLARQYMDETGELFTRRPGYLLVQDTVSLNHFPELAPVYMHTVIDSYSHYAFVRCSHSKSPESSLSFLVECVFPWLEGHGIGAKKILTDRGSEFFTPKTGNVYQQFLEENGIEHLLVKAYNSSRMNGLCRQFAGVVENEFCSAVSRKHRFADLESLQAELDRWLRFFNEERPQQARYCYGKTPSQAVLSRLRRP